MAPDGAAQNGIFSYAVAANDGFPRSAVITVAGVALTVRQDGLVCGTANTTITPLKQDFTGMAANGTINVTTPSLCPWTVTGLPSWISAVSRTTGTANGSFAYTVRENLANARSAVLSVAGYQHYIKQEKLLPVTCVSQALTMSVPFQGTLAPTDCINGTRGSFYYTDRYTFNAVAGKYISIKLASKAFDTYLFLKQPAGHVIGWNNDDMGTTNSAIPINDRFRVPASGAYTIEVTSFGQRQIGNYSVIVAPYSF